MVYIPVESRPSVFEQIHDNMYHCFMVELTLSEFLQSEHRPEAYNLFIKKKVESGPWAVAAGAVRPLGTPAPISTRLRPQPGSPLQPTGLQCLPSLSTPQSRTPGLQGRGYRALGSTCTSATRGMRAASQPQSEFIMVTWKNTAGCPARIQMGSCNSSH